jgi:hypothetical protein
MAGSLNYKIQLDSVRRDRNKNEYRMVPRATWQDMEEVGDQKIVAALCRKISMRFSCDLGTVEVFREGTPVFNTMPLKTWLKSNPFAGEQPEHLRK